MEPVNDPWMVKGGPAFPAVDGYGGHYKGASLRDYFAVKALPIAWKAFEDGYYSEEGWDSINEAVTKCSYQMADAMLQAREQ